VIVTWAGPPLEEPQAASARHIPANDDTRNILDLPFVSSDRHQVGAIAHEP
jgi:hypothetical protein